MDKLFFIFIFLMFSCLHAEPQLPEQDDIDRYVQQTMEIWGTPGIAISIVQNDKEIKVKGYGTRERGVDAPIDENTLFQICSLTKPFTGLSASMMVDEKKLDWEEPVKTYWPEFKVKDEIATKEITIRDLLSGRTGLPNEGIQVWRLWWHTKRSEDELIERVKELGPSYPIRAHFTYSNMAYVLASKVMENAGGRPWQEYTAEKIFKPLGMDDTTFSFNTFLETDNRAKAHIDAYYRKEPIEYQSLSMIPAAGGIISNAKDMTKWLKYGLKQDPVFMETQKAQSVVEPVPDNDMKWSIYTYNNPVVGYGYGWMIYRMGDKEIYMTRGFSDGIHNVIAMVPKENLGICILSNQSENPSLGVLLNILLEKFLNLEVQDWNKKALEVVAQLDKEGKDDLQKIIASRKKDIPPTLSLENYVGTYTHLAYGTVKIALENDGLLITTYNDDKGHLEHWEENDFNIADIASYTPIIQQVRFVPADDNKKIEGLRMPCVGFFKKDSSFGEN